ncbi:MAG TPA: hypothetical protein VGM80_00355 [Gaiellaceae bacterium]|jgi:uncharacterized alkaline shock family protein YloU
MNLVLTTAHGTVTVPESVLGSIAARAAEAVDGVRVKRRRTVDLESRVVRLSIAARRGEPLLELAERAQEAVAAALQMMCDLEPAVDIAIGELA